MATRKSGFVLVALIASLSVLAPPNQQHPEHRRPQTASIMLGPDSFAGPGRVVALAALSVLFLVRHRKDHRKPDGF